MINSFYTASTATIQYQHGFDVIANNISNISTQGYKSSSVSFADLLHSNIRDSEDVNTRLNVGSGSKLSSTNTYFQQGSLMYTGYELDYALTGQGFFAVQTEDGIQYTRNGSAYLSEVDGKFYLASSSGGLLLGKDSKPIEITDTENPVAELGVFEFENNDGLMRTGNSCFVPTETSGAISASDTKYENGYLEASNVDIAQEMANVIENQRAFQFNSKMVQIADEVVQTVNNLR